MHKNHSSDIKTDLSLLKLFVKNKEPQILEHNDLTKFESGDLVYAWTTEYLSFYYEKNLIGKKVLSVTSSGDHILHSVLSGATDVTGFDINRFCKYYSALKIAMIKKYEYEEFFEKIRYFALFSKYSICLDKKLIFLDKVLTLEKILCDVSSYLNSDERRFWTLFTKLLKKSQHGIEFFYGWLFDNSMLAYYTRGNYYILKENLLNSNCNIKYVDSSISNLRENVNEKFDYVYLSNILGRINEKKDLNKTKTLLYLKEILNKNGIICDYDFDVSNKYELECILKCFYDVNHVINDAYSLHFLKKR